MIDEEIFHLLKDENWHEKKRQFKDKIADKYSKELKGSRNFDFYIDRRTKEVFIKGRKSAEEIPIDLSGVVD